MVVNDGSGIEMTSIEIIIFLSEILLKKSEIDENVVTIF